MALTTPIAVAAQEASATPAEPASDARARAEAQLALGRAEADADRRTAAARAYDEALALFEAVDDREGRARVLTASATNQLQRGDVAGGERRAREAVELLRDSGNPALRSTAYRVLVSAVKPADASSKERLLAEAFAAARAAGSREDECALLHVRATDRLDTSDYAASLSAAEASLACYRALPGEGKAGRVLLTIGSIDAAHGQYEKALTRFEASLALHERQGDRLAIAASLSALAQTHAALGQEAASQPRLERALAIARDLRAETLTPVLTGIAGTFYVRTRAFSRATPLLEDALAATRNPHARILFLINLTIAESQRDRLTEARRWADRAVEESRPFGPSAMMDALRWRAEARRRAGDVAGATADLREGMALADAARAKAVPVDFMKRGFSEWQQELYTSSIALFMQTGDTRRALEAAEQARGRAFLDLLATRDGKVRPTAAATASAAPGALPSTTSSAPPNASRNAAERATPREPSRATPASIGTAATIATTATTSSAPAAADARPADERALAPRGVAAASTASPSTTAASRGRAADARDDARPGAAGRETAGRGVTPGDGLFGAALANDIVGGSPVDLENSESVGAPRLAEMAAAAARLRSTLITYWAASDELFIWIVTPAGAVHATRVPTPLRDLMRLVRDARQPADAAADGALTLLPSQRRPWRALYDTLIAPVAAHLPARPDALLTIVPHGPLFQVSFAALIDPRGRYLLERYRLHYAPSVGVLAYTARQSRPESWAEAPGLRARQRAGYRALLVGDPGALPGDGPEAPPLAALPWSRREVDAIAAQLGPDRSTVLVAERASEADVRAQLAHQDVLHFATHGIVPADGSLSSFLALRGSGVGSGTASSTASGAVASAGADAAVPADSTTDGRLTADEVYGLDLQSSLVVLSACGSALGPTMTGDGVIGFTRAFLYARAASVVATEWNVPDAIGYEVMHRFYRGWREGLPVSGALRRAQLETLSALRAGTIRVDTPDGGQASLPEHPVLWAAFIVAGEP